MFVKHGVQLLTIRKAGDDFLILEDGDASKLRTVVVTSQISLDTTVLDRIWTALLTFHLFAVPAILGAILGQMVQFADLPLDYQEDMRCCLLLGLTSLSLFFGLPLHVLSMVELHDSLTDVSMQRDVYTQTDNE